MRVGTPSRWYIFPLPTTDLAAAVVELRIPGAPAESRPTRLMKSLRGDRGMPVFMVPPVFSVLHHISLIDRQHQECAIYGRGVVFRFRQACFPYNEALPSCRRTTTG